MQQSVSGSVTNCTLPGTLACCKFIHTHVHPAALHVSGADSFPHAARGIGY